MEDHYDALESSPVNTTLSTSSMAKPIRHDPEGNQRHLDSLQATDPACGDIQAAERLPFIDKVRDIVGVYRDIPEPAVVLCVDERFQVEALNRM